jgi:oxygen-independent coproporphyrinogen-3 oxidase
MQIKARPGGRADVPAMDTSALIAKYDRLVPRYTSYPTAPHFSAAVDGAAYAAWLSDLRPDTKLSLYLHVPFCDSLCLFCGCHTSVARRREPLESYADTLLAEIDLVAATIGRRLPVRHVHWGGGTPTTLPPERMAEIGDRLRTRFDLLPDAEIAVEVDPRTLSACSLAALRRMGVTRASLGVQDFDARVQRIVNRIQPFDVTAACAERLRGIGVGSINLDLIYGLPFQTGASVAATIHQALTLAPDRIAVFGYAHVPWMKKHQTLLPEAALPGPEERFAQRQAAEQTITEAGYRAIGLDHFARPDDSLARADEAGRLRRNFQGYTTDDAAVLLGLGASSIGALPAGYVQNFPGIPAWREAVRASTLPTARGVALSTEDHLRRDIIERIMCRFEVDLPTVAAAHGLDPATLLAAAPDLAEQAQDGLVEWDGRRLRVTATGKPFVRAVAAIFDTYFQAGAARHAAAV